MTRMRALLPAILFSFVGASVCASEPAWTLPVGPLPLAVGPVQELRGHLDLAPGLALDLIRTGTNSPADHYEVNVGFVTRAEDAAALQAILAAAGEETKLVPTADGGATGQMVRLARVFSTPESADAAAAKIKVLPNLPQSSEAVQVSAGRAFTSDDGGETTGPYSIELLSIAPRFMGEMRAALATDVIPGRETTSALARRKGAIAAINGGFFQFGRANGTDGGIAGLSIIDGRLVAESVDGRPALFMQKQPDGKPRAWVERHLSTIITAARAGTEPRRIDGMNRRPGVAVNCGRPNDAETRAPLHDAVCSNDNAIILFTPDFGNMANSDIDGTNVRVTEVAIDAKGVVEAVRHTAGGAIPSGGSVLQGIGTGADWLATTFQAGDKAEVAKRVVDGTGNEIRLVPGLYAVNGGPTLVADGEIPEGDWATEGWGNRNQPGYAWNKVNGNRAAFYNGWVLRRNPRTAVGVTADGTILVLVSDGRTPHFSVGLSIPEIAKLMRYLGAVAAINLDGGGSSMLWAAGVPRTLPSDPGNTERADGDAILFLPR